MCRKGDNGKQEGARERRGRGVIRGVGYRVTGVLKKTYKRR